MVRVFADWAVGTVRIRTAEHGFDMGDPAAEVQFTHPVRSDVRPTAGFEVAAPLGPRTRESDAGRARPWC